ncbi:hypothetical protein FB45DRAFT_778793 [Roridomyces roridus]|uniref:TPR-like protein n=1 Tax=Roridomyces roridus TaxID=1738132 RepID=A0AAD7CI86_9AGAR|nr:hypothetical protein FB45DRAFT_778793 [Roridomyces roridus]
MSSAELKAEGNALFSAKNFKEASKKYTEAIKASNEAADPKGLAVLYANRAACLLSLKRYMDSCDDSKKATVLDAGYAKAWARWAAAKHAIGSDSEDLWRRALDTLPKSGLSASEETQKVQYQAGYDAAIAMKERLKNTPTVGEKAIIIQGQGRMPWDRAAAMMPRLRGDTGQDPSKTFTSSAWVIHAAYEEWMKAIKIMKSLKMDHATKQMMGQIGGIVGLSNAVMRDVRVFHINDNDFISDYNKQIQLEIGHYRPWVDAGPAVVIREALERQRTSGWDSVRGSISLTIRGWIMRGFMDANFRQRHDISVEFMKRSLEILRGLREHWLLEPTENRGVVFDKTFMFGIQNMYLDALMQCCAKEKSPELLEELFAQCDLLIREIDAETRARQAQSGEPVDPGFVSSFMVYPKATAYAHKGYYYAQKAQSGGLSVKDKRDFHRKGALEYINAADTLPEDDENHPWFLNIALQQMSPSRSFTLRDTLDVMTRIRVATPKAKAIWELSQLSAAGIWGILEKVGKEEDGLRGMLARGQITLNSVVGNEAA